MNPFPVQLVGDVWHVITGNKPVPCESKANAKLLAEIPVQHARIFDGAPPPPDRQLIETIIKLGDTYHLMWMTAFRQLKTWLAKGVA